MLNPPKTREEARERKYAAYWGCTDYRESCCAWAVNLYFAEGQQCLRKPGHGPDGLYCRQHAKKLEEHNAD